MPTSHRAPSRWNGLSPEEKRRERRQLLIGAAFELLADQGSSGTTVRAVCTHARLNPRYFYESFPDLEALSVAVYDTVVAELRERVAAAVLAAGDDTAAAVRAAVEATVRFVDDDRRRGRVLFVEALGNEALNLRRVRTGFGLVELVEQDTTRRHGDGGADQVHRLGAAMLVGGFGEILAAWLDGRIDMSAAEVIDAATQLCVAVGEAAASHADTGR